MRTDLTTKYRPTCLNDVLGQEPIVKEMRQFIKKPYSTAFLFSGASGVGKTSLAYALAGELGCDMNEDELGGVQEIASGEMDGNAVKAATKYLHYRPLFGSGWKVLIANEADRMTTGAETIWLDVLEHLPARSIVVFSTNSIKKLPRRFRDRCEYYEFDERPEALMPIVQKLACRVWNEEGYAGQPPYLEDIGRPQLWTPDDMHVSFRLGLRQLQRIIRNTDLEATASADSEPSPALLFH